MRHIKFLALGEGSFDTVEELVADGLISLYMEEHNVEQYINRQIFRRKSCKKNSRLRHIASARRALARYKDNKANGKSLIYCIVAFSCDCLSYAIKLCVGIWYFWGTTCNIIATHNFDTH